MATLRELISEMGSALPPEVAVAVARGLLARAEVGPPGGEARTVEAEWVEIGWTGGALMVRAARPIDLSGVGALLYEMLAGGPLHVPKDAKDAPPRPLAKLRSFLWSGPPLDPALVELVERLLGVHPAGQYASAEAALDALDAIERT